MGKELKENIRGATRRGLEKGDTAAFAPFLVLGASFLWGTSGTAQALAPEGATPLIIGSIRVGVGGALLFVVALLRGQFASPRRFLSPIFLLTGLVQALFNFSYFTGLSLTGVAVGTMVGIGSTPIFAGLLGIIFNRNRVGLRWYGATLIALVGIVLLVGSGGDVYVDPVGILFSLFAGFTYSFFTFLSGRLIRKYTPDTIIAVSFLIATAFLSPFFFTVPLSWMTLPSGVGTVLYLGFISSGLAYMLYGRGIKKVPLPHVGTLSLAEPLTASLLGIFLLHEPMSPATITGMILIFLAQVLIVTGGKKKAAVEGV